MSDVVSPDKAKPRTTYAGRMKKKRQETVKNDETEVIEDSEKEEEEEKNTEKEAVKSPPVSKRAATEKTFALPETPASANRKPLSTTPSTILSSGSKHARNGSLSSVQGTSRSTASPDRTESISDTESVATVDGKPRRKRKGEPERIQFFKDDPSCQEVEPHRALCSQCGEWQELHPKRRYVMQNWLAHKKTCTVTKKNLPPSTPKPVSQTPIPPVAATPLRTPTPSQTGDRLSPMEAEGKATLENDFRAGEIRPHEVFCTQCAAWVKLYPTTKYSPKNWLTHVRQCPGIASSSAASKPTSALSSASPNVRTPDDASSTTAVPSTPSVLSESPKRAQPPIDPIAALPISRKRPREESDGEGEGVTGQLGSTSETPAKRPVRRPRTESYKPPLGRALWDLVTKPIAGFIQGFKHGITKPGDTGTQNVQLDLKQPKSETGGSESGGAPVEEAIQAA